MTTCNVNSLGPDNYVLAINLEEGALVSLTTYSVGPQINIHDFTPADARAMADVLKAWADAVEPVQAVTE